VLVTVDVEGVLLALPLVLDVSDRHHAYLVTLGHDFLVGEGVGVPVHQLVRGVGDGLVVDRAQRSANVKCGCGSNLCWH
jgi:hypothetical protein